MEYLNQGICIKCLMNRVQKIKLSFLTFLIFSCVNISVAQIIDDAQVVEYSIKDGLSLSHITSVFQDANDFIWVGTQDGLNRFDGIEFKYFRHDISDSLSLSGNYIRAINQDENGDLWIATENSLMVFDHKNATFKLVFDESNSEFAMVSKIIIEDDVIWLNSPKGIFKITKSDYKVRYFEHFSDPFNMLCVFCLNDMIALDENKLLIASKDGLFLFNKESETYLRFSHKKNQANSLPSQTVISLKALSKDSILIGTSKGLSLFSLSKRTFKNYLYKTSDIQIFEYRNSIKTIEQDNDGRIWLGTKMGLLVFDLEKGEISDSPDNFSSIKKLQNKEINKILLDRTNSLWVATAGSNLYSISREKPFFNQFKYVSDVYVDEVRSLWLDYRNYFWMGTSRDGIFVFDDKNKLYKHISPRNSSIESYAVYSLFQNKRKEMYMGSGNGFYIYDIEKENLISYTSLYPTVPEFIFQENKIYDIEEDYRGNIWLATENGLLKLNKGTSKLYYQDKNNPKSISNSICYSLEIDLDSNLWIGTLNGLNKLVDEKNGEFEHFYESNTSKGLPNNSVLTIQLCDSNNLWIGTESGLAFYNSLNEEFTHYTVKDGLLNDYVYSVFEDSEKRIWFSTNRGVTRLNPRTSDLYHFDKSDGLQDYEFNLGAGYKDSNGIIYFGGHLGLNFFNPDSVFIQDNVQQVRINSILITQNGKFKEVMVNDQPNYEFYYKGLHLQISFVIPNYSSIGNNSYQYRMLGIDDNWTYLGKKHTVSFSQLPVGDYIFHVKGANNHGVWNSQVTSINIKIKPSLYNSKIAIAIYLLLGIALILMAVFFITGKLRKENSLLKQKEKDAEKIAVQKEELMQRNVNMRSSMEYAQRLIYAMMPSINDFKAILPETFIIYEPKDIVSGDFYWITKSKGLIYFAVVDCTGHGIPGAFMSIIGFDILRNIVNKQEYTEPSEILRRLSMDIVDVFITENTSEDTLQDGMDLSVCVLNQEDNTLKYAGAYNPLYLIRSNTIIEYKADRYSVGASGIASGHKFTTKIIQLQANDIIYLFSDGYTDQFGGPENKKFKHRRFRHLLLSIHKHHVDLQEKAIRDAHEAWRQDEEQVDDILLMGIRPFKI